MRFETGQLDRGVILILVGLAVFVLVLATLPTPRTTPDEVTPRGDFAIVDVLLFDGEQFQEHRDVWVEQGRIKAVGRKLALPDDLPRVAGQGRTLLPGLIDAHVHSFGDVLSDSVRFGATTVLDQFTALDLTPNRVADRSSIGFSGAADLFSAGMLATAPGGHGTQYGMQVDTLTAPEQARDWVRARKEEGSDWIKIVIEDGSAYDFQLAALDRATIAAVIEAAHAEDLLAVAHVSRLSAALMAVELGIDGLVHVWADQLISDADAARIADAGVFVTPTLAVIASVAGQTPSRDLAGSLDADLLSAMQSSTLEGQFGATSEHDLDIALQNVGRLHRAGVTILAGTDVPNPGTASGLSLHVELDLLVQAGLTPAEALAAATSLAATAYGLDDRGRVADQQLADLVLIAGDIRGDVSFSSRIARLWKDGEPVTRRLQRKPDQAFPMAPSVTLISSFDTGLESSFGAGWFPSTDDVRGGQSAAELEVVDGALRISGDIKPGFPFPWAGAIWFPGDQPMAPLDFSGRTTLRFRARGDQRNYTVMVFGASMPAGAPPSASFQVSDQWSQLEFPLDGFNVGGVISGLSFVAQAPHGTFQLEIDDVIID
ncbi:MAG: CIA30 family protein [Xanthomonadales bacterium]|nr:CIA30 family protein [Xanthomonadales bacterium]